MTPARHTVGKKGYNQPSLSMIVLCQPMIRQYAYTGHAAT
jgi:hypothetical protein